MLYIFVDPSGSFNEGKGHTGVATMIDDDWSTLETHSFDAKKYESRLRYWRAIIDCVKRYLFIHGKENTKVIIESFQIRTNGFLLGKMPETIMFIGALSWELDFLGVEYIFQTPTQAKSRFKDEMLDRYIPNFERRDTGRYYLNGVQTNDHIRDALKHLLYFKKYHKKEK
jgi:hypothetical protein